MTSRERIQAATNPAAGRRPDRLPLDLGGSIVTGINAVACRRLKEHLGLGTAPLRVTQAVLMLAEVEPALLARWGLDVIPVPRLEAAPGARLDGGWRLHPLPRGRDGRSSGEALFPEGFRPRVREDGTWELYEGGTRTSVLNPGSGSFVPADFPLREADREALEAWQPPAIRDEELDWLARTARRLFEDTERALFGWFGGSLFEQAQFLLGFEGFMLRLAADPAFMDLLFAKLAERAEADLERYLQAAGPWLQVVGFADDFGFQEGLQVSPGLLRGLVLPRLARLYGLVHARSAARVFLHSCGAVAPLIEDLIGIGVDILNPVQTSARGMEPEALARDFGGRICFWGGGADVQRVLPLGTPEEVRRDARRRIEVLGATGAFVFAPIHNLQADIPPANIVAMFEEAAGG